MKVVYVKADHPWGVLEGLFDSFNNILLYSEWIFDFTKESGEQLNLLQYVVKSSEDSYSTLSNNRNNIFLMKAGIKYDCIVYDYTNSKIPKELLTFCSYGEQLLSTDTVVYIIHNDTSIEEGVPSELEELTHNDNFVMLDTPQHNYFFNILPKLMSNEAREFGISKPKGSLLMGLPGTGKTMLASELGKALSLPAYRLKTELLFQKHVGESDKILGKVLKFLKETRCVVLVDEFDKLFSEDQHEVTRRLMSAFLTFLSEDKESYVVFAANRVAGIPIELLRKGRIDKIMYVDLPTIEEVNQLLSKFGKYCPDISSLVGKLTHSEVVWLCNVYKERAFLGIEGEFTFTPMYDKNRQQVINMETWAKEYAD